MRKKIAILVCYSLYSCIILTFKIYIGLALGYFEDYCIFISAPREDNIGLYAAAGFID